MGKILSVTTWEPATYMVGDSAITMELKRLNHADAQDVARLGAAIFEELASMTPERLEAMTYAEKVEAQMRMAELVPPEKARTLFDRFVRNVGGLEVDGNLATTGTELYAVADPDLVLFVVGVLARRARLTSAEGKGSRSPSTSSSDGAGTPSSSSSGAESTESAAGPRSSAATEELAAASSVSAEG